MPLKKWIWNRKHLPMERWNSSASTSIRSNLAEPSVPSGGPFPEPVCSTIASGSSWTRPERRWLKRESHVCASSSRKSTWKENFFIWSTANLKHPSQFRWNPGSFRRRKTSSLRKCVSPRFAAQWWKWPNAVPKSTSGCKRSLTNRV